MAIDKLTGKILEEAKAEADAILSETEKEVSKIRSDFAGKISELKQNIDRKAAQEALTRHRNIITTARIEARNRELQKMHEIIDLVFKGLYEKLTSSDQKRYEQLIRKMILQTGLSQITVTPGSRDTAVFRKEFTDSLKAQGITVTVSAEKADFEHGFCVKSGELEMDFSLNSLIESRRDELIVSVKKQIFSD